MPSRAPRGGAAARWGYRALPPRDTSEEHGCGTARWRDGGRARRAPEGPATDHRAARVMRVGNCGAATAREGARHGGTGCAGGGQTPRPARLCGGARRRPLQNSQRVLLAKPRNAVASRNGAGAVRTATGCARRRDGTSRPTATGPHHRARRGAVGRGARADRGVRRVW